MPNYGIAFKFPINAKCSRFVIFSENIYVYGEHLIIYCGQCKTGSSINCVPVGMH